jgi:hypothetical protein
LLLLFLLVLLLLWGKAQFLCHVLCAAAFGGAGNQNAIFHLSNLFPAWKSSITAIISGSFQLSCLVFFVFDKLWYFHGWSYQELFVSYAIIALLNMVVSLLVWPDRAYSLQEEEEEEVVEVVKDHSQGLELTQHNHHLHHSKVE